MAGWSGLGTCGLSPGPASATATDLAAVDRHRHSSSAFRGSVGVPVSKGSRPGTEMGRHERAVGCSLRPSSPCNPSQSQQVGHWGQHPSQAIFAPSLSLLHGGLRLCVPLSFTGVATAPPQQAPCTLTLLCVLPPDTGVLQNRPSRLQMLLDQALPGCTPTLQTEVGLCRRSVL